MQEVFFIGLRPREDPIRVVRNEFSAKETAVRSGAYMNIREHPDRWL